MFRRFHLIAILIANIVYRVPGQNLNMIDSLHTLIRVTNDDSVRAMAYYDLNYEWAEYSFDSAWKYANIGLELAQKIDKPLLIRRGISARGLAYDYAYRADSAIYYYERSGEYAESIGDSLGIASALFNIGVVHSFGGEMEITLKFYHKARPIYEALGNEYMLSLLYNNMGVIYRKTGKYELAKRSYLKSLEIKRRIGRQSGVLNTLTNVSTIFRLMQEYDSAIYYSNLVLEMAELMQNETAYQQELVNLADVYEVNEEMSKAETYYIEAYSMIDNHTPYITWASIVTRMSNFYYVRNEYAKAWSYLEAFKNTLREDSHPELAFDYYNLCYLVKKKLGDNTQALEYLERAFTKKTQLLDNEVLQRTTELEELYEKEKRENEIRKLNADNELQSLIIHQQEQRQLGLAVVAFLILLLSVLVFVVYHNNRKSLREKEVLLREIHHRVKNNLQVISSLLQLQAENLTDVAAIDAVREGENRVKSMSLIHQRLYSTDDVRGVSLQDYLQSLFEELFSAFGVDDERIRFRIMTHAIKLDIDTVIPLGLILTELITNSIKYAFEGRERGDISLEVEERDQQMIVTLKDDGVGMSEEAFEKSNSFGLKIVRSLARKLKAKIDIQSEEGTTIRLLIARYKLVV